MKTVAAQPALSILEHRVMELSVDQILAAWDNEFWKMVLASIVHYILWYAKIRDAVLRLNALLIKLSTRMEHAKIVHSTRWFPQMVLHVLLIQPRSSQIQFQHHQFLWLPQNQLAALLPVVMFGIAARWSKKIKLLDCNSTQPTMPWVSF
jgi:hypothetical protein